MTTRLGVGRLGLFSCSFFLLLVVVVLLGACTPQAPTPVTDTESTGLVLWPMPVSTPILSWGMGDETLCSFTIWDTLGSSYTAIPIVEVNSTGELWYRGQLIATDDGIARAMGTTGQYRCVFGD